MPLVGKLPCVPRAEGQEARMENFEQKLKRLEELSSAIKQSNISLEDALAHFEEGIKLARSMQQYLDEMEGKVQILMNAQDGTQTSALAAQNAGAAAEERGQGGGDGALMGGAKGVRGPGQGRAALALFDDTSSAAGSIKGTRA